MLVSLRHTGWPRTLLGGTYQAIEDKSERIIRVRGEERRRGEEEVRERRRVACRTQQLTQIMLYRITRK